MRTSARTRYAGYRFPAEIIGHAVWLYFRFPLGLRMVEDLLAARGIIVSHETVRQWARKFGQPFANRIRRRFPPVIIQHAVWCESAPKRDPGQNCRNQLKSPEKTPDVRGPDRRRSGPHC